ncbi:MAG: polysaccharide deacetylase family protein [Reichenbachiella sp.]
MKFKLTLVLFLLAAFSISAQKKQVCFTIDDLPVVSYGDNDQFYLWNITLNLISKFDKYNIPAIGFVNEGKLFREGVMDSSQLDLLKLWFQNGYEIGNHTFSHLSYHKSTFEEFKKDLIKGESISRHLEQEYNKELRYFRHPYLQIGNNQSKYDKLNALLDSMEYTVAPVTIGNKDWMFASAYAKADRDRDRDLMAAIGDEYVSYTRESIKFSESQSQKLFTRNIRHVMLIHANKLNADYLDEIADVFIEEGYEFITLNEILKDPAYQSEITVFKENGTSWLDSWAQSRNLVEGFYEGAPVVPEWIENP